MNEDEYTIESGHLSVGDGHKIYYQTWGNKDGTPIFHFHGGPGNGTSNPNKSFYDPAKHYVIFHDQRGTGKSTPEGSLKDNTTQKLVKDIDALRAHLGIHDRIQLFGGSWGSTLALAYAIEYPQHVSKMLINGIYTGTKRETNYLQQGGLASHFPESWERYIEVVPKAKRNDTVGFYYAKLKQPIEKSADFVRRWVGNEAAPMSLDSNVLGLQQKLKEVDESDRLGALFEAHYFLHDCFLPDNFIFDNAEKLQEIDIVMVQGRFDHVCPPETAYKLAQKIGDNCRLHVVPGSHANKELVVREVLRAYVWSFLD